MATFTGLKPKDTYDSILHVENNDTVNASLQYVQDGYGNNTTIRVSTLGTEINNPSLIGTVTLGSPLSVANGGLGVSLSDPNADRILFWDDSAGSYTYLSLGTNLSITGTTINVSGGLTDADYGDIIVSGAGTVMTIDNLAVTYGKIQNVSATDKLLGRSTAGAGVIEEITCTGYARSLLDDATSSDARTTLGLGTLATQSGTFSGTSSGTNTGDQTITLTGDVTGSGTGSFATTIANDVVTYAKMQNVSTTDRLLGRVSAAAGDIEEIPITDFVQTILDDADASAVRTTLGLGTLATQSGTFSGTSSGTNTGDQNLFSTIAVSGQSDVVADAASDTLTLVAGANVTITTNAGTDTITIAASGGGGGGLGDGDYGDITVSGTSTVLTIDNDVVTYAKMQNVSATDRLLGRVSALAGDVEEIPITDFVQTILDDTDAATVRGTIGAAASGANTDLTSVYLNNTGLKIKDTNASHGLTIAPGSDITADRTLTVTTGDADRTLTISGSTTLSGGTHSGTNTGDQTITLTGAVTGSGTGSFATSYGDVEISSIAGLTSAADSAPYYTGSGTAALMTVTSAARTVLDDASVGAMLTTLGGQPLDATLTSLAAYNTNGVICQTSADTFTGRTITGTANQVTVTNGDGVSGAPTLSIPYNVNLGTSSVGPSSIAFFEDTDFGSNKVTVTTPTAGLSADYTFTLPPDGGTVDYVLRTDGTGVTTWVTAGVNLGLTTLMAQGVFSN